MGGSNNSKNWSSLGHITISVLLFLVRPSTVTLVDLGTNSNLPPAVILLLFFKILNYFFLMSHRNLVPKLIKIISLQEFELLIFNMLNV